MIPIHPVAGSDEHTLRWRVPADRLPSEGEALLVPEPLATSLRQGVVTRIVVGGGGVDITLGAHRTWRADGPALRTALLAALESPEEWVTVMDGQARAGRDTTLDDRLSRAARDALAGEVGDLARSHGGRIELESVRDGVVMVRMSGACHGCPAAGITLHTRLERALRRDHPDLKEVRGVPAGRSGSPLGWLTKA